MEVSDGRGANKKIEAKMNKDDVERWFKEYPGSTIKACCDGLKLSYTTVKGHINSLIEDQAKNGQH
jgi:hypothetical protein